MDGRGLAGSIGAVVSLVAMPAQGPVAYVGGSFRCAKREPGPSNSAGSCGRTRSVASRAGRLAGAPGVRPTPAGEALDSTARNA